MKLFGFLNGKEQNSIDMNLAHSELIIKTIIGLLIRNNTT